MASRLYFIHYCVPFPLHSFVNLNCSGFVRIFDWVLLLLSLLLFNIIIWTGRSKQVTSFAKEISIHWLYELYFLTGLIKGHINAPFTRRLKASKTNWTQNNFPKGFPNSLHCIRQEEVGPLSGSPEPAAPLNLPSHLCHQENWLWNNHSVLVLPECFSCHQPPQGTEEESFFPGPVSLQGSKVEICQPKIKVIRKAN